MAGGHVVPVPIPLMGPYWLPALLFRRLDQALARFGWRHVNLKTQCASTRLHGIITLGRDLIDYPRQWATKAAVETCTGADPKCADKR
jgi:hypothetical protein